MKKNIFHPFLLLMAVLLAACATLTQVAPTTESPVQPLLPNPEKDSALPTSTAPTEPTPAPIPGGFPQAAFLARQALAEQLGVPADQIEIRNVEAVEWPDGCLGLAGPDEMCTMAIVPGYRVTLVSGTTEYRFRTNQSGLALRRETGPVLAAPGEAAIPFVTWQNSECTEAANLLQSGLAFGACDGPFIVAPWQNGMIPDLMLGFLDQYAPFEAETPAGKLAFYGIGEKSASPAEQRAIAEWMKIQFMAAQSGRTGAAWGLAFSYSRQGGIVGFCDDLAVYLDGSAVLSSCKDVNVDFRLSPEQLEKVYAWYDGLRPIDFLQADPASADGLTIKLALSGQGAQAAGQASMDEILAFCAELIRQARADQ